jgi:hypothetical protein
MYVVCEAETLHGPDGVSMVSFPADARDIEVTETLPVSVSVRARYAAEGDEEHVKVAVVPAAVKSAAGRDEPDTATRPPIGSVAFSVVAEELKMSPEIPASAELKLETVELESPDVSPPEVPTLVPLVEGEPRPIAARVPPRL